jgi:hypothetical protein
VVRVVEGLAISKLSPFTINRGIVRLIGEPEKIRKLKEGTLLVQARAERQASLLLNANLLGETPVVCEAYKSLNTTTGDTITEELADQGVLGVRRITRWAPPSSSQPPIPTNLYVLSFGTHSLP